MSKKKIIIPIVILVAAVTVLILLIPHQTDWKGTYNCYNLESLNSGLNGSDSANDVLDHIDIDCDFTFILNPISYRGEGTVIYNGKKFFLNYVTMSDPDPNRPVLLLESSINGDFSNRMIISKDAECFIINENYKGWRIVFSGEDPTVEEVRSRVSELGLGSWFGID